MKLYKIKLLLIVIAFSSVSISCKKYLSEMPDNRTTINSVDKVNKLLAGAYDGPAHFAFTEPMTDNVADGGNTSSDAFEQVNQFAYKWQVNDIDDEGSAPLGYWLACYKSIAAANQALLSLEKLPVTRDAEAAKAEALLIRAYYHFMLVNLWGKQYNPNTSGTDLGVPYVLTIEDEPFKKYKRNTVKEVYDFIEKDINDALPFIQNNKTFPKYKFSPDAAKALASRFYLNKGDWDKVIKYSTEILPNPDLQVRDWVGKYTTLGVNNGITVHTSTAEPANILIGNGNSSQYWYYSIFNRFSNTQALWNTIANTGTNPFRLSYAYVTAQYAIGGNVAIRKFNNNFVYTNPEAQIGYDYMAYLMLTYDEVLLNRAEAYAMKGDNVNALKDMTTFCAKKLRSFNATTNPLTEAKILSTYPNAETSMFPFYTFANPTQASIVKFVAEMKRREFIFEGMRWFDIRRFDLEIKHPIVGSTELVLTKGDNRKQLQIPKTALDFGLEANPR
jgi:hypothetical protein